MAVLAERGYHAARVDDVVRRARTSHGTFDLYFANKEDLFRELANECAGAMETLAAELGPVTGDAAGRERLRSWLDQFVAIHETYGAVIQVWMEGQVGDPALTERGLASFAAITSSLIEQIERAKPRHLDRPDLAAGALLAMVERFTYLVTSRGAEVTDRELDAVAGVVHRGFFAGGP
jgi:AcrR family transcriptional regulator